jgi:rRNA maturation endonuclease Nob1
MRKILICSRCGEFIGKTGIDVCPICGGNLIEEGIFVEEENEEE